MKQFRDPRLVYVVPIFATRGLSITTKNPPREVDERDKRKRGISQDTHVPAMEQKVR